ncbi:hypothetical protein FXO37_09764 [Capsicum annuum]|nr:hypothetical protein FXO37_09764 [Capsicum annuum]
MVDDGSYSHFSGGKVAFEKLMASISRSMNEVQKFYPLSGLPYALQIWWYECCAKVYKSLAVRVHNLIPRMVSWKVVKPKPRYEDLMDDMFSKLVYRNITLPPQELNHLDLPNPLMFSLTDAAANISHAVAVQQQSERTSPTEFDDFSTSSSADLLKKMRLDASSSIDSSEPQVSLDKDKVVPNVEMRDADKASATAEEKLSLSKTFGSCERRFCFIWKGGNEGAAEESLKESEEALHNTDEDFSKAITLYILPSRAAYPTWITYFDVAAINTCNRQGNIDSQYYISDNAIAVISQKESKLDTTSEYRYATVNCVFMNYIHDTYTHYHRSHSEIDLNSHDENVRSIKVASVKRSICEIMQGLCISAGILWHLINEDYGVNKTCTGYVSENQDPPRPKHTFIQSEDTEMIDVEP